MNVLDCATKLGDAMTGYLLAAGTNKAPAKDAPAFMATWLDRHGLQITRKRTVEAVTVPLYLVGDEHGPDLYGTYYDHRPDADECAELNGSRVWTVSVQVEPRDVHLAPAVVDEEEGEGTAGPAALAVGDRVAYRSVCGTVTLTGQVAAVAAAEVLPPGVGVDLDDGRGTLWISKPDELARLARVTETPKETAGV